MRLPVRPVFFEEIKAGRKTVDYRDAHITFVNEETGETLTRKVRDVSVMCREYLPTDLRNSCLFDDDLIICFMLMDGKGKWSGHIKEEK